MTRGKGILLATGTAAVLVAVGALLWPSHEPVYEGKPVSFWLAHPKRNYLPFAGFSPPIRIFKIEFPKMDSNAIPYLIDALDRRDSKLQLRYEKAYQRAPTMMQRVLPSPAVRATTIRANAASVLRQMKPAPDRVIQALIRSMQHDMDGNVRCAAATSLLALDDGKNVRYEVWLQAQTDGNSRVQVVAHAALDWLNKALPERQVGFPWDGPDFLWQEK